LRQAQNAGAERRWCEIRLRAERKAGEILRHMEKATSAPGNQYTGPLVAAEGSAPTLHDLGITHHQSSRWQKLADFPLDTFGAALAGPDKPTTASIISAASPARPNPVSTEALWLWDETGQSG
jgi:hypothetical protein